MQAAFADVIGEFYALAAGEPRDFLQQIVTLGIENHPRKFKPVSIGQMPSARDSLAAAGAAYDGKALCVCWQRDRQLYRPKRNRITRLMRWCCVGVGINPRTIGDSA